MTVLPTNYTSLTANYSHSMSTIAPTKHHTVVEDNVAKSIANQCMTFFAVLLILCMYFAALGYFLTISSSL